MADTQLNLRWHSHNEIFTGMLQELHMLRTFTDVSLICDGGVIRAHKAVLSLCSPYLATVLSACRESDEARILLPDISVQDISYLVSFIYRGQVDVSQAHIASFLNTGKHLHVLGLEQGDRLVEKPEENVSLMADDDLLLCHKSSNNNVGEKKTILHNETPRKLCSVKPSLIKAEDIKMENGLDKITRATEDGKLDLNLVLQQAIQSAAMPCPLCHKEFKSQSGLRDHIRIHTGDRPFICEFCHMNFARASHLKRHRRMHTGEKPFECSICGKDFSRGDKLKDHLRRHESEEKLVQIRKQIMNPDQEESRVGGNIANIGGCNIGKVGGNIGNAGNGNGAFIASSPTLLMSKVQDNLLGVSAQPPAAKRQCLNPSSVTTATKIPLHIAMSQISQGQLQGLMDSPQSENVSPPQMMGVTSIGECILRPIN